LNSARFDSLTDPIEVIAEARILVATLNGAVRLRVDTYQNVACLEAADQVQGANVHAYRHVTDRLALSDVASVGHGILTDDPSIKQPIKEAAHAALSNETVARALRFFAEEPPAWSPLYKVWEIIERSVGRKQVVAAGWATSSELEAFTMTANHQALSGDAARHSMMSGTPTKSAIDLKEGVDLCRRLLSGWLLQSPPVTPP
jgi:hypothetical protein